jgi:hypothetical protein
MRFDEDSCTILNRSERDAVPKAFELLNTAPPYAFGMSAIEIIDSQLLICSVPRD